MKSPLLNSCAFRFPLRREFPEIGDGLDSRQGPNLLSQFAKDRGRIAIVIPDGFQLPMQVESHLFDAPVHDSRVLI